MRSGRDEAAVVDGVDETLVRFPGGDGAGPPKKSRPNNESAGFDCLGGADSFVDDCLVAGIPVVLSLVNGGGGISPKISAFGTARCSGAFG